ncbi:metallophosphoesterase [candidate division TA06 bacterium]|nr:metallophosphoesterase [candidate division TA06 bacterium]
MWGDVHFFALNSNSSEPDGADSTSIQAQWLQSALATSTRQWKIVYFHHAAYSSGSHGNKERMQWPFQNWNATAVIAGHDHTYERILKGEFPYFVNGLGGRSRYSFGNPIPGSQIRYNDDFGAMLVVASVDSLNFKFINRAGDLIDNYTILSAVKPPPEDSLPDELQIYRNSPNPFRSSTTLQFFLPQSDYVTLKIYDLLGREVTTLLSELLVAGIHSVQWEASSFPSGTYFYYLHAGRFIDTGKGILLQYE